MKKKIWLMGGFGNVLFQILSYNIISKRHKNIILVDNLTKKNFFTELLNWSIWQPIYIDLVKKEKVIRVSDFYAFFALLMAEISKNFDVKFDFATFYTKKIQINQKFSNNIFGYFQDKDYLFENKQEILDLGKNLNKLYSKSKKHNIVVHYRKGSKEFSNKFLYYYQEIKKLLINEVDEILIVSESYSDAILFFNDIPNINIISSENALDDFKHLISTKKLYCAPSTFSWWAAHSLDEKSEIIMPKYYDDLLGVYSRSKKLSII